MQRTIEKYRDLANSALDSMAVDQRWKIVAILANKKPISVAVNDLNKSHPIVAHFNPARRMHAELSCLIKAPKEKIDNSIMYVWRFGHTGLLLANPCDMCVNEMRNGGVKKVIYSTSEGFIERKIW
ncbi:MAG: hypothetical protein AABY07_05445 [Nanoarchaeota archaeon]